MFDPRALARVCREILPEMQHVAVDAAAVAATADRLAADPPGWPRWDFPAFPEQAGPGTDALVWLGNALNFCYWVEPGQRMWAVEQAGEVQDDAPGLLAALRLGMDAGLDLCDAAVLDAEAPGIFQGGQGTLPLVARRVEILREVAAVVAARFDGRLENAVAAAGVDAAGMAGFLAETFPSYRDGRELAGRELPLLKRAQLAAGMLHARRLALGAPGLHGVERLTAYADYMLPRVLRHLGVLVYSSDLARRVDALEPLAEAERAEAELRVATVGACELLVDAGRAAGADFCAAQLDYWLWREGFGVDAPHHRTVTTDY